MDKIYKEHLELNKEVPYKKYKKVSFYYEIIKMIKSLYVNSQNYEIATTMRSIERKYFFSDYGTGHRGFNADKYGEFPIEEYIMKISKEFAKISNGDYFGESNKEIASLINREISIHLLEEDSYSYPNLKSLKDSIEHILTSKLIQWVI